MAEKKLNRRDPRFVWEESGRSLVAHFGNLSVSVRQRGSMKRGDVLWRVDYVFGNPWLGGKASAILNDVLIEAEQIALREALALSRALCTEVARGR